MMKPTRANINTFTLESDQHIGYFHRNIFGTGKRGSLDDEVEESAIIAKRGVSDKTDAEVKDGQEKDSVIEDLLDMTGIVFLS